MSRMRLATSTLWSQESYNRLGRLTRTSRADIVHFHNTFPLISPACYYAAKRHGAAVVQTLHNYRLACPSAVLARAGRPCEECRGRLFSWPGVLHACYRNSRSATAVTGAMLTLHRGLGTWTKAVDAYIALTDFARLKFITNGLPSSKIHVKPIFLEEPPQPPPVKATTRQALFVGRLTEEKGLRTLLDAWQILSGSVPLTIVGDGPLSSWLERRITTLSGIFWLRQVSPERVRSLMRAAGFLIIPSTWYEGLPVVSVEAFAAGCPIIASKLGNLATIVRDQKTGLHFAPGDARDLAAQVRWLSSRPEQLPAMKAAARSEYERHYQPEGNYRRLISIYQAALARAGRRRVKLPARAGCHAAE